MVETPEMESPSARQDCLVEAQEDSTSVEHEPGSVLSPSETTSTTAATTPPAADDVAENERRSVTRNSCENLTMVCERLDEKPNDEGRSEDEQSSDYSRVLKQEEEKEIDMNVKMGKEDESDSTEKPLQLEELSGVNFENAKTETAAGVSRKRPAGSDFLPIGAEIKRIGVEISEEEATQLRNDVRRLSPVLVSQRERTLGEVSLTAESCLFGMDGTGNDVPEISLSPRNDSEIKDVAVEKETLSRIDASSLSTECADSNNEDMSDRAIGKVNYDSEEEILGAASPSRCNGLDGVAMPRSDDVADASGEIASCVSTDSSVVEATSPAALSSPTCRRLVVVLNRCEKVDLKKKEIENLGKSGCDFIAEKNSSESRSSVDEECNSQMKETPKKQRWQGDNCTPTTRPKRSELTENVQSPDGSPVLKNCTVVLERISEVRQAHTENGEEDTRISKKIEKESVAPVAVIGKLEEDEEVVLTSSSSANENAPTSHELDSTETMPSSPEETQEAPPVDVAEAVDTETETETGSDSSEVSLSIAGIRELRDVDVASSELPCSEAERGDLCCVEVAMAPIMTRLETERPEPYTEDSAESLALATGARDEVRSDGSDSGLGNELAGDPGPAPAPESDSETSFLDRLPDDILSDKEKSKKSLFRLEYNKYSIINTIIFTLDVKLK